jgi:hypothetical protein
MAIQDVHDEVLYILVLDTAEVSCPGVIDACASDAAGNAVVAEGEVRQALRTPPTRRAVLLRRVASPLSPGAW